MKKLLTSPTWRILALTGLGVCLGVLTLVLSAVSYLPLVAGDVFRSYFLENPLVALVNLLPPIGLMWLGWFLTRRGWAAYLLACLPCLAIGLVNYFKISLRSDPLLAGDVLLAAEAGGMVGGYELDFPPVVLLCLGCALAGLLAAAILLPKGRMKWPERLFGLLSTAAILFACVVGVFLGTDYERRLTNNGHINQWSDVEVYISKGALYSFLHSAQDLFHAPPAGYDEKTAEEIFLSLPDADIPEEKKVSVMGVMLEAFCDLTDFPALAGESGVQELYAPWHALEAESVTGDLLTNIFAGGTVDSEWGFLTGYSRHEDFRSPTDSYVWYFRDQGYRTFGSHPGHGWFYNRQNVNEYLGFEDYWFTEDHYGALVDPTAAIWNSDHILFPEITEQLKEEVKNGPCFSFSVSYQNHGPYEAGGFDGEPYVTNLDPESGYIFNNYLRGLGKTIAAVTDMVEELRGMEEPVVLVLFGDHKPWGGNGNSAYTAAGVSFDMGSEGGFTNYYATPYLIWANPAAKAALGRDFVGDGGDFSPCFLMTKLFDLCGFEGSGFMSLQRRVMEVTPLLHTQGLYWQGGLTDELSTEDQEIVDLYLWTEYYREHCKR